MQSKKKGFTLIELLAVIVILAIIALIAVPVIMNVIGNARKSAFEDSVYGIIESAELYYSNQLLEPEGMTEDKEFVIQDGKFIGDNQLEVSGSLPNNGTITVTKGGKVAVALTDGETCVRKATTESEITTEKLKDLGGKCKYKRIQVNPIFTATTDDKSVPECIANNTECTSTAIKEGIKVGVKVNDEEIKNFYVISENANEGTITLIMNENLGDTVEWASEKDYGCGKKGDNCSSNDKGPLTALKALENRTSNWTNIPLETYELTDDNSTPKYASMTRTARARMITYTEARKLKCVNYAEDTCPTWLSENTCDHGDDSNYGYWTSSAAVSMSDNAFILHYKRSIRGNFVYRTGYGVRPVITIAKSII